MLTARQSLYARGSAGEPLGAVWNALEARGIKFLRGQVVLICAGPGVGKSAFILAYAVRSNSPALYFSADSDWFTQTSRMLSMKLGWDHNRATQAVLQSDVGPDGEAALDSIHIRFNFEANPTLDEIELETEAYLELYGDYPELVVIDNLTNIVPDDDDGDLERLMDYCNMMARKTAACVVVLHHVTGQNNDGNKPIPMSGIKNQIGRVPAMVLTLHRVEQTFGTEELRVSPVKNRGSKSDATGLNFVALKFDGNTMRISDITT